MAQPWEMDWGQSAQPAAKAPWEMDWGSPAKSDAGESPKTWSSDPRSAWEKIGDTTLGKIAHSAVDAFTLPHDAYYGQLQPGDEVKRSFNAATWATPVPAAMRAGEGIFGVPMAARSEPSAGISAATTANEIGAPLPRGLASDSKVMQSTTKAAQQLPLVGPKIGEQAAKTVEAAGGAVGDITNQMTGGITDRAASGAMMRPAIKDVIENNNNRIGESFDSLRKMLDQSEPVAELPTTEKVLKGIIKEREAAGHTNPSSGLENVQNLVDKGATFDALQRARSELGSQLKFGVANPGYNAGDLKRLMTSTKADLEHVVRQSFDGSSRLPATNALPENHAIINGEPYHLNDNGTLGGRVQPNIGGSRSATPEDAVQALKDAYTTAGPLMEFNKTLENLTGIQKDESLIGSLTQAAQNKTGNVKILAQLRNSMPKQDFQQIGGVALAELGHNASTGKFSLNQFATKWEGMGDRAKSILFSPEHKQSLDNIAQLGRHLKDADKFANTSNTAGSAAWGKLIAGGAGAVAALTYGDPTKLVAGLAGLGGGLFLAKQLAKPATASSIEKWTRAAVLAEHGQSPARISAFRMSTRNLLNNLEFDQNQTSPQQSRISP